MDYGSKFYLFQTDSPATTEHLNKHSKFYLFQTTIGDGFPPSCPSKFYLFQTGWPCSSIPHSISLSFTYFKLTDPPLDSPPPLSFTYFKQLRAWRRRYYVSSLSFTYFKRTTSLQGLYSNSKFYLFQTRGRRGA